MQGKLKLERVGRKFFNPAKKKEFSDLKIEVWPGNIYFIFKYFFRICNISFHVKEFLPY